jgi:cytochrome c oxidase subunit 4
MGREIGLRVAIWAALLALLALTIVLALAPLGPLRLVAALVIAAAKAGLIGWFYMDLRKADGVTRLASVVGVIFITILILMASLDFALRAGNP